jgi:c-di-GMP-specific phosphodiesterase
MPHDGSSWDATATLAALGGGEAVLWAWAPREDRLSVTGAVRALGLGPLAPDASSAALQALVLPQDRHLLEGLLQPRSAGQPATARLRVRGADACVWRGAWQEDGRLVGLIAAEARTARPNLDPLTGLLDRRSFVAETRARLEAPGQHHLIVADLDRLRRLNEALGHERADLVLTALANRLAAALPQEAVAARIGEDEFAAFCPAAVAPAEATLRMELERPLRIAGLQISPKLSVAHIEARGGPDAPDAAELLRRASVKLETVRAARSSPAAPPSRSDGLSRLALENELPGAFERGEFVAFYQPIVRLADGGLVGFEALARWRHPRRGLLTPEDFLPVCEELGLMGELGAHMRRQAARSLASWRVTRAGAANLTVSVNLSAAELEASDLADHCAAVRREAGLPPGALKLEVTESEVMRRPEQAAATLHALRDFGLRLALDDFGVGFSSLAYLTRLPFDTLKIDAWFVRNLGVDPGAAKIVASVVKLGQDLGMEVVAEGVEHSDLARQLQALGCNLAQGFAFARALSPESAAAYVARAELGARKAS